LGRWLLRQRGAHEEESIHRGADGGHPEGGRPQQRRRGGQEEQVSEQTIYSWRKHFGELAPVDVKRLRALEAENNRLKRLLAERDLDISVLKEINAKKW
jgi:putative transposase